MLFFKALFSNEDNMNHEYSLHVNVYMTILWC